MVNERDATVRGSEVVKRGDWLPTQVSQGLGYYKHVSWIIDEDITPHRPTSQVYEVFVGVDSETHGREQIWAKKGDDAYHASLCSRHPGRLLTI